MISFIPLYLILYLHDPVASGQGPNKTPSTCIALVLKINPGPCNKQPAYMLPNISTAASFLISSQFKN